MTYLGEEVFTVADDDAVSPVLPDVVFPDQVVGDSVGEVGHGAVGRCCDRFFITVIIAGDEAFAAELFSPDPVMIRSIAWAHSLCGYVLRDNPG